MKISVIIPAYNGEKYIAQCIENVLCQTYKDLEIIVVNDGSTDRTAEIAAGYPGVKLVSQQNQGLSVTRNNGAKVATGDYIHFLDVDDLLGRDYYERMVEALDPGVDVDMVFGGFVNEAQLDFSLSYSDRLLLVSLEDKISVTNAPQMGYAWRYLIRREFMEKAGLQFEPGRLIEDMPFTLEAVAAAANVVTAPEAIYYYMKREGSILNSRNPERVRKVKEDYKHVRELRRDFMRRHNLTSSVTPHQKIQYKILGIPMLYKIVFRNGKTKWYFLGIRLFQKKPVRP